MISEHDIIGRLQGDVFGILSATPSLSTVNIILDDENTLDTKVEQLLTRLGDGEGKRGLCIVVMMPEITEAEKNLPGPVTVLRQQVQIIEHVGINTIPGRGTGIRSRVAAIYVLQALHLCGGGNYTIHAEKNPARPLPVKDGFMSYMVTVYARPPLPQAAKTAVAFPVYADGTISFTCSTEGAEIRFTTDGSYPCPKDSTLYTEPIAEPPAGTLIRAVAFSENRNPSDVAEILIS
jgi:hypothetical protein